MTLLQCARGDSLQEEGGVADISGADRDAMEAREAFWSMSGDSCLSPPRHAQRTIVCAERVIIPNSVFFYIAVVRQTKKKDNVEESSIEEVWRFNGDLMFSDCCSGSTRFCILNKRPLQGNALVDGRLSNKTQVTSRPEPICPEKCKSVSTCAQKKGKAAMGY